jgi:outer membrane murein-binding lipoprotein Lpp
MNMKKNAFTMVMLAAVVTACLLFSGCFIFTG